MIEYIQNSIQENLDGVKVKPTPVPFSVRLDRSSSGDFDTVLGGWAADYADQAALRTYLLQVTLITVGNGVMRTTTK